MARIGNQKQKSLNALTKASGSSSKRSTAKQPVASTAVAVDEADPLLVEDLSNFLNALKTEPNKDEKKKKKDHSKKDAITPSKKPENSTKKRAEDPKPLKSKGERKKPIKKVEDAKDVPKEEESILKSKTPLQQPTKAKLVVAPTPHWYTAVPSLPANEGAAATPTASQLSSLMDKASSLHASDVSNYTSASASTSSTSDAKFLFKVLQSGTLSDRLSAMTLMVQGSPVHNIKALENLKNMAERGKGQGGREESLKALRCIVDWWVGGGAPDRKLRYFRDQPLLHPAATDQHLLTWFFEDWLKKYFFSVLQILEMLSLDPLIYVRTQSLSLIATLLRDKPEQEQNLLRLLVNKLGDTEKSICSRVSYHLLQLLQGHPSMKSIVVREIISLVLKPPASSAAASSILPTQQNPAVQNTKIRFTDAPSTSTVASKPKPKKGDAAKSSGSGVNPHARYYATITFNQIVLSPSPVDKKVSKELIDVYFELFKELLGEGKLEEEVEVEEVVEAKDDDEHRKKHERKDRGNGKRKGKGKETRGEAGFTEVEDSTSKLVSAILTGVNRALPFAKMDAGDVRFNKHIDTLFLITHTSTFNISLQALLLILQITTSMGPDPSTSSLPTSITDRFYRTLYASLFDPRLSVSSKQAMYLNLLFKSLKVDKNSDRVQAFVRRFIQVLATGGGGGGAEFIVGGLYLLGELFNTVPGLKAMLQATPAPDPTKAKVEPERPGDEEYDPRKRDPQYAHASKSPLWELLPLVNHYHPTISLHAHQLLTSQPLTSTPDLALNTLSHFLDRFVYKNPKQKVKAKGSSAMQPAAGDSTSGGGVRLFKGEANDYSAGAGSGKAVNDETWWKRRVEDVPIDQLFFHKYFNKKNEREKAKANKVEKRRKGKDGPESGDSAGEEDADEVPVAPAEVDSDGGSEEDADEAEIWKAMKASMPDLGVDDGLEIDSDDVPSGLDDDDSDIDADLGESDEDEDQISMVEDSDAEDLIPLDYDGSDISEADAPVEDGPEEWGGIGETDTTKTAKRKRNEESQNKRKKLKSLPTFASYEDYAKMIEDAPEDDV